MSVYTKNIEKLKECMPLWTKEIDLLEAVQIDEKLVYMENDCIYTVVDKKKYQQESQNKEREKEIFFFVWQIFCIKEEKTG